LIILSFLQRIFGKKEEVKEQIFSIEDAEGFLSKNFDENFQVFKEDASKIYQDMQSTAVGMQNDIANLKQAEYTGPVDSELLQKVVAHKKSFIQKMEAAAEQIKRPMQLDLDSILEFSRFSSSAISETNAKTVVDYQFLKELFEKEADSAIGKFKILSNKSNNFENLVRKNKDNLFLIKNAQDELQSIKDEMKKLSYVEEEVKSLQGKLSALESERNSEKEKLEKFEGSEDWLRFKNLLEKKKKMEEDAANIKSQMLQVISKIEKPMKKFKNLVDRGIVKIENEKVLERYAISVFDALIGEKNPQTLYSILNMLEKNISEGKIELKEREKSLDEIKWLVESNVVESLLEKYLLMTNELEKVEASVDEQKTPSIRDEIERRIEYIGRGIERSNMEIGKSKKQIERIKVSINERKISLENALTSLANKKISMNV